MRTRSGKPVVTAVVQQKTTNLKQQKLIAAGRMTRGNHALNLSSVGVQTRVPRGIFAIFAAMSKKFCKIN